MGKPRETQAEAIRAAWVKAALWVLPGLPPAAGRAGSTAATAPHDAAPTAGQIPPALTSFPQGLYGIAPR